MKRFIKTGSMFLCLLLLAAGFVFTYNTLYKKIKSTNENVAKLESEIEFEGKKSERLKSLGNIVRDTEADRAKLDTFFVSREEFVDFIKQVESVARVSSVVSTLGSLNTQAIPAGGNVIELMTLEVTFSGKWSDVVYFLNLIEKMPYKISVDSVNFRGPSDSGLWQGTMSVNVLKLKK